jgi:hypothetical protein
VRGLSAGNDPSSGADFVRATFSRKGRREKLEVIKPHIPPPPAGFRSGSTFIGGGHAEPEDLGSLTPVLFWILFLFFSISALLFGAALTDVCIGVIASATEQANSVKNRIADLIMRRSCGDCSNPMLMPCGGTLRHYKRYSGNRSGLRLSRRF